ncbi:xylulose kinase [Candidatus Heimdallarchaeota archaeon B3_Heim]|nr:MAG: xylulose kinase [Candidatus Heimdallarchaeota archaeon B3_Heim]
MKLEHSLPKKYILAFDHGTSGIKAALVSIHGEVLDFVYEHTPVYFKDQGGAEQNPNEWWQAILNTSKELLAKDLVPVEDIVAVSSSSQWSGTVAVDEQGEALMNAIIWMDARGAKYLKDKIFRGLIKISGYPLRDVIRFLYKTGGAPTHSGKDPIAHILFLKYEYPEIYEKTYKFLECIDYLNLKFTGKFAASTTSIILHWITNNRDINNIRYDKSLINRLKVDGEKFPDLHSPTSILGDIKPEVADELGLNRDVKIAMGAPDLQSAVIGSGAINDYQGHIYIGTSSWLICHVPYKKTDISHNIASIPSAIPGRYFVVNEQETAGASLSFLRDNLFYSDDEDRYGNSQVYQSFDKLVEQVPAGSNGVLFTPWLYGERTPVEDHKLRGSIFNLSLTSKREDIIRAAFEGVAYNSRWVLKYVEKFAKRKLNPLNIIGGGARSDVWCQIYADVLNRTIRQVKDPIQANARGAALIASVALGYIEFEDIPNLTQISQTFTPNPENVKLYDSLFKEFLLLYKNNKKAYHRLNR